MAEQPKPATGYPYASAGYPPPPSYPPASNPYPPPPSYYPPPPYAQPNTAYYSADEGQRMPTSCRCFLIGVLSVFVILGAIIFIVWLVLCPEVPEFSVTALAVPAFNITSSNQLKADWDVTFTAYNRNKKMAIQYEDVRAAVSYRSEPLASTTLSPFRQETRNTTTLVVHLTADSYVPDSSFAKLKSDRSAGNVKSYVPDSSFAKLKSDRSAGNVKFNFGLLAYAQFRSGAWRTKWRGLRAYCYDVEVNFGSNSTAGNLKSSPTRCAVFW